MPYEPVHRPSGADIFLNPGIKQNPAFDTWRDAHNRAFESDNNAMRDSELANQQLARREELLREHPRDQALHHEYKVMESNEDQLRAHTPPNAMPVGGKVLLSEEHSPVAHVLTIRDTNTVTRGGEPWGFVYRMNDGSIMLQRDAASTDIRSESDTQTTTLGGKLAGNASPFGVGVTAEGNGSSANAVGLTIQHPNVNAIQPLKDLSMLPIDALVTPLRVGDVQLAGSRQILPAAPHGQEFAHDSNIARPDPLIGGVPLGKAADIFVPNSGLATVGADREGQLIIPSGGIPSQALGPVVGTPSNPTFTR